MDAEKMAREFLMELFPSGWSLFDKHLAALLTTAHNTGLERAAEIADNTKAMSSSAGAEIACSYIAQAIRREIK